MPLATLTEVKTLLMISGSTYDSLIEMLIPLVETEIIEYCQNEFIGMYQTINGILPVAYMYSNTGSFVNSDNSYNDSETDFTAKSFKVGDVLRFYNTLHNDRMFTIESIAENKIVFDDINTVNDEAAGNTFVAARVDFPENLKINFALMIKYRMAKHQNLMKSEKFNDYSYTKSDKLIRGYPADIMEGFPRSLYKKTIPFNILYFRQA